MLYPYVCMCYRGIAPKDSRTAGVLSRIPTCPTPLSALLCYLTDYFVSPVQLPRSTPGPQIGPAGAEGSLGKSVLEIYPISWGTHIELDGYQEVAATG